MASPYCIIGKHGLLGSGLARRLGDATSFPTADTRVLFHFGSYTHLDFEQNPHYHIKAAIDSFTALLPYCYEHGIKFVFPSSALVYERDTQFSMFKKTLEQLAATYDTKTLGLRIFPVYGPGEERTVISQWCRDMAQGKRPVVYGDGSQARDFIYVDDAVEQILLAVEDHSQRSAIVNIGAGRQTKFNEIVQMINRELDTSFEPQYVNRPSGYSEGIFCPDPLPVKVSVEEGIRKMLASQREAEVFA